MLSALLNVEHEQQLLGHPMKTAAMGLSMGRSNNVHYFHI
jgi:hypothetical protein